MRSDLLVGELASIIRRLEHRILTEPGYAQLLDVDSKDAAIHQTLQGIEDAIAGLVVLHIHIRKEHQ